MQSTEGLAKVDTLTPCRYGAPTMLIVAFDKNNVFTYPGQKYDSGIEDASIVTTHMMLCAKSVIACLTANPHGDNASQGQIQLNSFPKGERASFARRKCIFPKGMPMMVMQNMRP